MNPSIEKTLWLILSPTDVAFGNCHSSPRRMCGFTVDDDPCLGFCMGEGTAVEDEWAPFRERMELKQWKMETPASCFIHVSSCLCLARDFFL